MQTPSSTADAKRPKHHLDTSRKPPKPQAKKLFHDIFGIHIKQKQSLEPQNTCPAYANTIWNHIKQLWSQRAHAQPMQTLSSTADAKRPKHHLDTSRKPPKPQAKKLFHVTFGIHIKQKQSLEPQSTCPAYANTIWTLQMQKDPNTIWTRAENRPNRKPKSLSRYHAQPMQTPSSTADAKRPKHHLDTSRKPPKPQAKKLFHVL